MWIELRKLTWPERGKKVQFGNGLAVAKVEGMEGPTVTQGSSSSSALQPSVVLSAKHSTNLRKRSAGSAVINISTGSMLKIFHSTCSPPRCCCIHAKEVASRPKKLQFEQLDRQTYSEYDDMPTLLEVVDSDDERDTIDVSRNPQEVQNPNRPLVQLEHEVLTKKIVRGSTKLHSGGNACIEALWASITPAPDKQPALVEALEKVAGKSAHAVHRETPTGTDGDIRRGDPQRYPEWNTELPLTDPTPHLRVREGLGRSFKGDGEVHWLVVSSRRSGLVWGSEGWILTVRLKSIETKLKPGTGRAVYDCVGPEKVESRIGTKRERGKEAKESEGLEPGWMDWRDKGCLDPVNEWILTGALATTMQGG
ncbi:hypothetical protein C8R46DRAFT_1032973 [Mycena filopes]|nr:hypothetical protein C8R46DRAFT_1032973 [Mycena filopes]